MGRARCPGRHSGKNRAALATLQLAYEISHMRARGRTRSRTPARGPASGLFKQPTQILHLQPLKLQKQKARCTVKDIRIKEAQVEALIAKAAELAKVKEPLIKKDNL